MKTDKHFKPQLLLFQLILAMAFIPSQAGSETYEKLENFSLDIGEVTKLVHKQSGASLVLVQNEDQARGFTAAFRTPPYDNTGLFHVLEHSVLKGSRLYPSKSNNKNVKNASIASHINAYTSFVHTHYPFISLNSKDFTNLLFVYMDAVLFPKAIMDSRIVKREGWRYEINPKTQKLSINGIVLNEMKGTYSSVNKIISRLQRFILPDTPYAYDAGGDPEEIINLEFDQIVSAHKKYYHPQNMLIYLYGALDFEKLLSKIDENFLSYFEKDETLKVPEIALQKAVTYPPIIKTSYYGEKGPDRDLLAKAYTLGPLNPIEKMAFAIMMEVFLHENGALKTRIMNEGLAPSVYYHSYPGKDNAMAFIFKGTESSKREKITAILKEEIDKVIQNGLDAEILASVSGIYNSSTNKNRAIHKANGTFNHVVDQWLYQTESLEEKLKYSVKIKKIKPLFDDKSFVKKFFQRHFKENEQTSWFVLEPDPNYHERFNLAEKKKSAKALKRRPLSEYRKEDEIYKKWAAAKEPPEIKNTASLLELSDFKEEEKPIPFRKHKHMFYETIEYPQALNGISYVQMFFDLRGVSRDNIKNLSLFSSLLTQTDTKHISFEKLQKSNHPIETNIVVYQSEKTEEIKPFMQVSLSFENKQKEKLIALLKEILLHSKFSPESRVHQLIKRIKTINENIYPGRAEYLASRASKRPFSPEREGLLAEIRGASFTEYILKSEIDPAQLSLSLNSMRENIFNQKRLQLITVAGDEKELKPLVKSLNRLSRSLPRKGSRDQIWHFDTYPNHSALAIPSAVQYLAETADFKKSGLKYSGALKVYSMHLESHFLYPHLREQMGAYNVGNTVANDGLWTMSTWRAPHLDESFEIFSKAIEFMKQEQSSLNQKKIKPAIISALKFFYRDFSKYDKVNLMTDLYLEDSSWEKRMQFKREIMKTTPEDFKEITRGLEKAFRRSHKAVVGNAEKIKESGCFKSFADLP